MGVVDCTSHYSCCTFHGNQVVAHNAANRLYLCYKLGMPLKNYRRLWMQNAEVSMFELEQDGEVVLRNLNTKW